MIKPTIEVYVCPGSIKTENAVVIAVLSLFLGLFLGYAWRMLQGG